MTTHLIDVHVQLQKLGIIPFDEHLSGAMLTTYKIMWANNGDFISRQYTGTAAMKVGGSNIYSVPLYTVSKGICNSLYHVCRET